MFFRHKTESPTLETLNARLSDIEARISLIEKRAARRGQGGLKSAFADLARSGGFEMPDKTRDDRI